MCWVEHMHAASDSTHMHTLGNLWKPQENTENWETQRRWQQIYKCTDFPIQNCHLIPENSYIVRQGHLHSMTQVTRWLYVQHSYLCIDGDGSCFHGFLVRCYGNDTKSHWKIKRNIFKFSSSCSFQLQVIKYYYYHFSWYACIIVCVFHISKCYAEKGKLYVYHPPFCKW